LANLDEVRVLIVDDSMDTCEFMAIVLGTDGARVLIAGTATEALATIGREPVDVLVCDIGLPDLDGCALLHRIRALGPERGAVPAIALTGYSQPESRDRIREAGYAAHLVKPVDADELGQTIARVVGRAARS
jgi:CheY-like chemotaxis protein